MLAMGVETSVPASAYAALGDEGTRALIAIFERTSAPKHVRLRALAALAELNDERAARYLVRLVEARDAAHMAALGELHPARSAGVLRRAMRGLAGRPGLLRSASVLPYLTHRDASIRAAAVRLLAHHPEPAVTAALRARLQSESARAVREALANALRDRSAPPASPPPDAPRTGSPPR